MIAVIKGARHEKRVKVARLFGKEEHHVVSADFLFNKVEVLHLCAAEQRIMSGNLEKKVMTSKGIEWQTRLAVLSEEWLSFAKPQEAGLADALEVLEYIPLYEIEAIHLDYVLADHTSKSKGEDPKGPPARSNTVKGLSIVVQSKTHKNRYDLIEELENEKKKAAAEGEADYSDATASLFEWHITLSTTDGGHNGGRTFVYRVSAQDSVAWHSHLTVRVATAIATEQERLLWITHGHSVLSMTRAKVGKMYEHVRFQIFMAVLILLGFVLDLIEAQTLPEEGSTQYRFFLIMDVALTSCFGLELLVNMFAKSANNFKAFRDSKNNLFDMVVVMISVIALLGSFINQDWPPLKVLRLARVLRVVRLFRGSHFEHLNRIAAAIGDSVYPLFNAFIIVLMFTIVFSILATHLFRERSVFFNTFAASLFTMFQVLTGDWASSVARTMFDKEGNVDTAVGFFFIVYLLIASMVLMNVVIAVLLDNFIMSVSKAKELEMRIEEYEKSKKKICGILDPVTSMLTSFDNEEDLMHRIDDLYHELDTDGSGGLYSQKSPV
jgi:hypothetical protein